MTGRAAVRCESAIPGAKTRGRRTRVALGGLVSLALTSCFREVGRLDFAGEGEAKATMDLAAGDVRFGADLEVRNSGHANARYDVDLIQSGRIVGEATCDPLDPGGKKSCMYKFANRDYECNVVMACKAHLDHGGPTTVRARFLVSEKPPEFALHQADLVVGR